MTYSQTLDYLYARLPMFTKIGASAIKKDLTNTIALCSKLDNPHRNFKSIHVAGTNGKGSTSHMLAAVLQTAGYKTGLYTSPHLKDFRERIRINGEMISEEEVIRFVESQKQTIEEIEPSFFEVTVAMAFKFFSDQQVDIAVIETGLGGRLDSTNVINPVLSIITNIGYDHTNILGNTLTEIAFEKAGIIKPETPIIISEYQPEVEFIFQTKAEEMHSEIAFASEQWEAEVGGMRYEAGGMRSEDRDQRLEASNRGLEDGNKSEETRDKNLEVRGERLEVSSNGLEIKVYPLNQSFNNSFIQSITHLQDQSSSPFIPLNLDLTGSYQVKNIKGVLSCIYRLNDLGFTISADHVQRGLNQVKSLTGLQGRWQTLGVNPLIICDTGHNEAWNKEVLKNIEATRFNKLHIVLGMVKDKDISKVLSLLPKNALYYFCSPQLERAKPSTELAAEAKDMGLIGEAYPSVKEALEAAENEALPDDLIFVGGSTFVVAEVV